MHPQCQDAADTSSPPRCNQLLRKTSQIRRLCWRQVHQTVSGNMAESCPCFYLLLPVVQQVSGSLMTTKFLFPSPWYYRGLCPNPHSVTADFVPIPTVLPQLVSPLQQYYRSFPTVPIPTHVTSTNCSKQVHK